jgi:hypothetical protein
LKKQANREREAVLKKLVQIGEHTKALKEKHPSFDNPSQIAKGQENNLYKETKHV